MLEALDSEVCSSAHLLSSGPLTTLRSLATSSGAWSRERNAYPPGLTSKAIEWRLATGRWRRVLPGVYQTMPGRDDWWTSALAAQLAVPQAAWSQETAGYAWGLVRSTPGRIT